MKNKSAKLPFVTKNSKHLVGTGADDLLALIKFAPLWKTKVSKCMQQEQNNRCLPTLTIVKVYEYKFK